MSGYIQIVKVDELSETKAQSFDVSGKAIILCRKGESVYALEGRCSHAFQPLDGARIRGESIMCPHHGARFDMTTGKHLAAPAVEGIAAYAVRIIGGMVEVNLENGPEI